MTKSLRIGVIGAGRFGECHLAAYSRQPGVSVVAVADRDAERAKAVASRWGIEEWFDNGSELINACNPDGVSVVTPGSEHRQHTEAALSRGCCVLLEKPVAVTAADANAIVRAAEASAAFVMPAHILRFAGPYIELYTRMREGAVGRLLAVSSVRDRGRGHTRMYPDIHPALMTLIHDIDLALWLSGSYGLRASAHGRGGHDSNIPSLVWAHVEAADGSVWSLHTSWLLPDMAVPTDRLEVYGTDGAIVLELRSSVTLLGASVEAVDHELTPTAHPGAIDAELQYFCECIRNGSSPTIVTLAEAVHGVRIAEAIMASIDEGGALVDIVA